MGARIRFLAGPRKGKRMDFDGKRTVRMGRDLDSDVRLTETNASRLHALLAWSGEMLTIEDAGSRNGVFVNGIRRRAHVLAQGDVVVLAGTVFRVDRIGEGDGAGTNVPNPASDTSDVGRACAFIPNFKTPDEYKNVVQCLLCIQEILAADRESMVGEALLALIGVMPASRLSLLGIGDDGKLRQLHAVTEDGPTTEYVGRSFARKVLASNKAILLNNADSLDPNEWGSTMRTQRVCSIMGVPIVAGGETVAVLLCDNRNRRDAFDADHVALLEFAGSALSAVFQRYKIRRLEERQAGLDQQLLAARVVQKQILSKDASDIPGDMRWMVLHEAALEVGGDFYDYRSADGLTTWVMADVCGKGVPAALVVSMLKAGCKALYPQGMTPGAFLKALHELLVDELPLGMFFTALVIAVDAAGKMTHASCGQDGALVVTREAELKHLEVTPALLGMPMGAAMNLDVIEQTVQLRPGDRVLAFTDGVTEAGESADLYGMDRLEAVLKGTLGSATKQAFWDIVTSVRNHEGPGVPRDDKTIIFGEFAPPHESA
jgi:serine phosphatase RsbU (regulator of sigma subunit)